MKVHVEREACCSQDDQIGPLTATYELPDQATLQDLVDNVLRSGFLQFSSTHTTMVGSIGATDVVRVFGSSFKAPRYVEPGDRPLGLEAPLRFRSVFDKGN